MSADGLRLADGTEPGTDPVRGVTYQVAVVHRAHGVAFVSVATSPDERERRVADYVRRQADRQLAPRTRAIVLHLLGRGALAEAIRAYFDAVGSEWEPEWLYVEAVSA